MADKHEDWLDLIPKLPGLITAAVALVTAVVGFAKLWRGDTDLVTVVLLVVGGGSLWLGCVYLAFKRIPPLLEGGRPGWKYPGWRPWARAGLVVLPLLALGLGGYRLYQAQSLTRPCAAQEFCIVIADFGVKAEQAGKWSGTEVSTRIQRELSLAISERGLGHKVTIRTAPVVPDEQAAVRLRQAMAADVLIWGKITEPVAGDETRFVIPYFILDMPTQTGIGSPPPFQSEFVFDNTGQLAARISDTARILTHLSLAGIYLESGEHGLALIELDDAVQLARDMQRQLEGTPGVSQRELQDFKSGQSRLLIMRGLAHQTNHDFGQAEADLHEAASLDALSERPHLALGNLYYVQFLQRVRLDQEALDLARENYQTALRRNRRSRAALYGLGNVEFVRGDYEAAIERYEQAVQLSQSLGAPFPRAHYALGLALLRHNRPYAARDALRQAQLLASSDPALAELVRGALVAVEYEIAFRELPTPAASPTSAPATPSLVPTASTRLATMPVRQTASPTPGPARPSPSASTPPPTTSGLAPSPTPAPGTASATPQPTMPTLTATVAITLTPSPQIKYVEHIVRGGDTLLGIARQYKVPMEDIATANALSSPYTLQVGQRLRIPNPPLVTATPPPSRLPGEAVGGYVAVARTQGQGTALRARPGGHSIQLRLVDEAERLYVLSGPRPDEIGDPYHWWQVRDEAGLEGWVREDHLVVAPWLAAPVLLEPPDGHTLENPDMGLAKLRWASDYSLREGEAFQVVIEYPMLIDKQRVTRLDEHWLQAEELIVPSYLAYLVEDLAECKWTVTIVLLKEAYQDRLGNRRYHSRPISLTSPARTFVLEAWKPGVPAPETRAQ